MTMEKKFITIDLETGKKVLQTLEASFVKFSDKRLPDATNLDEALKAEITRALAKEKALTDELAAEVTRATGVEDAIKKLIGVLEPTDASVKDAIDRIEGLISTLTTSKVDPHIANRDIHITAEERIKWDKAVADVATKADQNDMTQQLATKVNTVDLFNDKIIKPELLPSIAVNTVHTVSNEQEAMDLTIENGDVVIINPDAKVTKNKSKVVKGTFICVDIKQTEFEKRFRQLYSNSDSISKAEVTNLISVEEKRALAAEKVLRDNIETINGGDTVEGSIKHAVKGEQTRAEAAELALSTRIDDSKVIIDKLAGSKTIQGSAAYLADEALTQAKAYTAAEIETVNTAASELSDRVQTLETTVGNTEDGLVKDVKELQGQVSVINGEQEGSIKKALADAKAHAEQKVADEAKTRKDADDALDRRIVSLETNENLAIKLGCVGIAQHELLAIRADNNIVRAELSDSNVVGIVTRADGPNSKTVVSGRVSGFQGLKPGKSYFLGSNGQITDQMPTNVNEHIIKIGVALTTTDLFVNIEEAIEIRA